MNQTINNVSPNQGIWRSLRYAVRFGLIYLLLGFLVISLTRWAVYSYYYGFNWLWIAVWVASGVVLGILGFLLFGGYTCIKHFSLRIVLASCKCAPWNLAKFLNDAVDHIFLRRVGGSYIFAHRMLLEYFADYADND